VAGDKFGRSYQIWSSDNTFAESDVRDRNSAGLLGVVNKITLRVKIGVFANNFDGILVGADRPVGAQTIKKAAKNISTFNIERIINVQTGVVTSSIMRQ